MLVRTSLALLALTTTTRAQTTQYFAGDGSVLTASKYGTNPGGPFTTAFTSGNIIGFGVTNGTGTGGSVTVGGFNATENFTLTAASGTITNAANGVVGIAVGTGKTLDFGSEAFTTSATAGYTKSGDGTLALTGAAYGGGFTLNAGTVILRGVNAMGGAAANTLAINGGIIAGSANRDLTGKYAGGITVGGNFQLGALAANSALASDTANLTFSNNINLGAATRTITLGNKGTQTLGGVISGTAGLTFNAVSGAESTAASNGTIAVTGTANGFTGPVSINGPEVSFAADGSLGNTANTLNIDGGRFTATASFTLNAGRGIQVGGTAGTSISTKGGATVLTYNGIIADKTGSTGILVKQGGGTLVLGGANSYSGDTNVNNGTLQLTAAANRLPTGTTVNVGQAASANLGTLDLNGQTQQVAGLNSVTGTNASTTLKNTVTSSTATTLTLGGSGSYSFGNGTITNSGVITGALAISKTGSGTQTFGDANTYTGGTQIGGGALVVSNGAGTSATGTGTVTVNNNGTLLGNGYIAATGGAISVSGVLSPGGTSPTINAADTIHLAANTGLTLNSNSTLSFDITSTATKDLVAMTSLTALVLNGGTLALNLPNTTATGIDYSQTYALFTGVSGVTGSGFGTVTGYDSTDYLPSFMLNGNEYDLTFTSVAGVPEPATYLGGLMLLGVALWSKRRAWYRFAATLVTRIA